MSVGLPRTASLRIRSPATATFIGAVAIAVAVSAIQGLQRGYDDNLLIFRAASDHLRAGLDLYAPYPALAPDLYKYSPTFALLCTPWALLPFPAAHLLWMLFCALSLWAALTAMYPDRRGAVAGLIVAGSLVLDLQRSQTNALVAALMIGAFVASDRKRVGRAALLVGLGTAIKLFPAVAAIGIIWQPSKRRAVIAGVVVAIVLMALPLLVTTPDRLWQQYLSWFARERLDAQDGIAQCLGCLDKRPTGAALYGGIMYQLRILFGPLPNLPIQVAGLATTLLCAFLRRDAWNETRYQRLLLSALLLFCVVFNHQAESPSFVIAVCGMAIWYLERGTGRWQLTLLIVCAGITTLGAGDIVPRTFRLAVMLPYRVRTIPCFVMWIVVLVELWRFPVAPRPQVAEVDQPDARTLPFAAQT
jgi:Glycosyltransferase family 87